MIAAGTLCYYAGLVEPQFEAWNGRVVEVVGHEVGEDGEAWHVVAAGWLDEALPGREVQSRAVNLVPIVGPTRREEKTARPECAGS